MIHSRYLLASIIFMILVSVVNYYIYHYTLLHSVVNSALSLATIILIFQLSDRKKVVSKTDNNKSIIITTIIYLVLAIINRYYFLNNTLLYTALYCIVSLSLIVLFCLLINIRNGIKIQYIIITSIILICSLVAVFTLKSKGNLINRSAFKNNNHSTAVQMEPYITISKMSLS